MKTKLEMAHDWAMKHGDAEIVGSRQNMIKYAWDYADAMQDEADKRENEEAAKRRKEIREMLNAPNTFVEREGRHFDDFCSDEIQAQRDAELYGTGFLKVTYDSDGVKYERLDPETISVCSSNIGLDSQVLKEWQPDWSQVLKEWQPDWSQAPSGYDYWVATADHDGKISGGWFYDVEPKFDSSESWHGGPTADIEKAPSFGYTGDWRNSLRKRPK